MGAAMLNEHKSISKILSLLVILDPSAHCELVLRGLDTLAQASVLMRPMFGYDARRTTASVGCPVPSLEEHLVLGHEPRREHR